MAQSKLEWRITGVILIVGAGLLGYAITKTWWGAGALGAATALAVWLGNAAGRRQVEARRSEDEDISASR
jgi:hypothetical protein